MLTHREDPPRLWHLLVARAVLYLSFRTARAVLARAAFRFAHSLTSFIGFVRQKKRS